MLCWIFREFAHHRQRVCVGIFGSDDGGDGVHLDVDDDDVVCDGGMTFAIK